MNLYRRGSLHLSIAYEVKDEEATQTVGTLVLQSGRS